MKEESLMELESGIYLVATPIGNLGDITLRALDVLRSVDFIAAEDTRVAKKLCSHFEIKKPIESYFRETEVQKIPSILERVKSGKSCAVISDAGTPAISDPGEMLVKAAVAEGVPIIAIPGATAFIAALISSGLPTEGFLFCGFPPAKEKKRQSFYQQFVNIQGTLIFYESPHRIKESLSSACGIFGNRHACLSRELTKKFEEHIRGPLQEILAQISEKPRKGEMVLLISGAEESAEELGEKELDEFIQVLLAEGLSTSKLAKRLVKHFPSLDRKDAYQRILQAKDNS